MLLGHFWTVLIAPSLVEVQLLSSHEISAFRDGRLWLGWVKRPQLRQSLTSTAWTTQVALVFPFMEPVYVWVINIKTNVIATSMSIQNIWRDPSIVCSVYALSGLDQLWGQVESFMPPLCKSKCRVLLHHPPLLLKALILHTHIALLTEPWLVGFHNPLTDGSDFFQVKWGPCLSHDNTKVEGTGRMAFCMWSGGQQGP